MRGKTKVQAAICWLQCLGIGWGLFVCGICLTEGAEFSIVDQVVGRGEIVQTQIRVSDFTEVQALQFSLSWDPEVLQIGDISQFGLPGLGPNSFGVFTELGRLSVIWDSATLEGESLGDNTALFSVAFQALAEEGRTTEIAFSDAPTQQLLVRDLAQGVFESTSGTISIGKPPLIVGPESVSFSEDQISAPIPLTFSDDATPASELTITVASLNESLVAASGIQLNGDGGTRTLVLESLPDQSGRGEIQIFAMDESGAVGTYSLLVTVVAINDPPTAVDDTIRIPEDSAPISIDVLRNDTSFPDLEEELRLDSVETPSMGGTVQIVSGQLVYEPSLNFNGIETIRYTIKDNLGLSGTATLSVSVDPINDPPTLGDDFVSVNEDGIAIQVPVLENDSGLPDTGEILVVTEISLSPTGGQANLRNGQVFYRPSPDFFGDDIFRYSVDDGSGSLSEGTVFVSVIPVNDPPLAVDDGISVPEDSRDVFFNVLANDLIAPDANEILMIESVSQGSSGGAVRIEGAGLRYTPASNFFGIETFQYVVSDGSDAVSNGLVTVTVVNDRADAPVVRDDRISVEEDSMANLLMVLDDNGNGSDFDPDGDSLMIVDVGFLNESTGMAKVNATRTGILYTPRRDFVGSETIRYVVSDGDLEESGLVFIVVSEANNDPPVAFDDYFEVAEDSVANRLNVLDDNGFGPDSDPENDLLSVRLAPGRPPESGSVEVSLDQMALIYTPNPNFSGTDRFSYFANDGVEDSLGSIEVMIVNVDDDPPVARDDRVVVHEDQENQILELFKDNGFGPDLDPEGARLTIVGVERMETTVGAMSVNTEGNAVLYTPVGNFVGSDSFAYTVSDGTSIASAVVSILVENSDNDPPVTGHDQFVVIEDDGIIELDVLADNGAGPDFDPEGQPLMLVGVDSESLGSISLKLSEDQTTVIYELRPDFFGVDEFRYRVSDGENFSEGTVVVIVTRGDNEAPLALDDKFSVQEDSVEALLPVIGSEGGGEDSDPDGDLLRIVASHGPGSSGGSVRIAAGAQALVYTPKPDFAGEEFFSYTISDGALTSSARVIINVTPVADPPRISNLSSIVAIQGADPITLPIEIEDIDTPLASLSVRLVSNDLILLPQDQIQIDLVGGVWTATLKPVDSESGLVNIRVMVSDGDHDTEASILLTVEPVTVFEGEVSGGYLGGGGIFVDLNNDGLQGEDEPGGRIRRNSRFRFSAASALVDRNEDGFLSAADGHLVVAEGFDYLSGTLLGYEMRGPIGASVLSPFSSMVSAAMDADPFQSLSDAIDRVSFLLSIEDGTLGEQGLLDISPVAMPEVSEGATLSIVRKMAALDALVSQVNRLISASEPTGSLDFSRKVLQFLASEEQPLFAGGCASVNRVLNTMNRELLRGLNDEVIDFSEKIICAHLGRISSADLAGVGRLRAFSDIQIMHDLRTLGAENRVPDALWFRYLDPDIESKIQAYPFFDISIGLNQEGTLRFLDPVVSVIEGGAAVSRIFVVRDGGSLGGLDAAVLPLAKTASQSVDFLQQPLRIRFSEGQLWQELDLASVILDDSVSEGEEFAELRLFYGDETDDEGIALVRDTSLLSIIDSDHQGYFEFASSTFAGGEDDAQSLVFVKRGGGMEGDASVIVNPVTVDGAMMAEGGGDFVDAPILVQFRDGELIKGVSIPVIPDLMVEPDESIVLELQANFSDSRGAVAIGLQSRSIFSIINDDFDRAPTIVDLPQLIVAEDGTIMVPLIIGDAETSLQLLDVQAVSLDPSIVLVDSLEFDLIDTQMVLALRTVPNAVGPAGVRVSVSDGNQSSSQDLSVLVTPINDVPQVFLDGDNHARFVEDEAPVPIASSIRLEELDGDMLVGAQVSFSAGYRSGEDRLIFGDGGGSITGSFNRDTGVLALSGQSTVNDYEHALRRVLYDNRSDNPTTLSRVISITVTDSVSTSESAETVVVVDAVNDRPFLARTELDSLVYIENSDPVFVSKSILIVTADDQFFTQAIARIRENYVRDEDILVVTDVPEPLEVSGFDSESGHILFSGKGTLSDYQNALRSVQYRNLSDSPTLGERVVEFTVTDGELQSEPKGRSIRVLPVDDPPVIEPLEKLKIQSGQFGLVRFSISDPDSPVDLPLATVQSENPSLIIGSSIVLQNVGEQFELQFQTRAGQLGDAEFTIIVETRESSVRETFRVTVVPTTNAPRVKGPSALELREDSVGRLKLTMVDDDDVARSLNVTFQVDNVELFPPGTILLEQNLFDLEFELIPAKNKSGVTRLSVFVSDASETVEHRVEVEVVAVNDLPTLEGLNNAVIDPGASLEFNLVLSDVESPINQLLIGLRPLDPRLSDQVSFEVRAQGDQRGLRLSFDDTLRGVLAFELVVVDSDGGTAVRPFEVTIREAIFQPESLRIDRLDDGRIELRWEGSGSLAIGNGFGGPFLKIPNATSPFQLRSGEDQEFFRLVD